MLLQVGVCQKTCTKLTLILGKITGARKSYPYYFIRSLAKDKQKSVRYSKLVTN
ncbi:MAG: hypothetical protein DID92_2727745654 [Candidatus Nitrotoga sp. SPKER]|nr:MAG: hypothetical protein DID92_2727745654 [Candidatus Nitrotoga sp. SPKER]